MQILFMQTPEITVFRGVPEQLHCIYYGRVCFGGRFVWAGGGARSDNGGVGVFPLQSRGGKRKSCSMWSQCLANQGVEWYIIGGVADSKLGGKNNGAIQEDGELAAGGMVAGGHAPGRGTGSRFRCF